MNVADQLSIVNENFSLVYCRFKLCGWHLPPKDLSLKDLDRILREEQDPCTRRKTPGFFGCPCIFCTGYRAHHVKPSHLDPAPAPAQQGLPVQNGEIFILSKSLGVATFALRGSPTRLILTNFWCVAMALRYIGRQMIRRDNYRRMKVLSLPPVVFVCRPKFLEMF